MNAALAIAEQMLMDRLMSNKAPLTGESKAKIFLISFASFMGLVAICFMFCGLYLWLSANYSLTVTMFSMAAAAALLSILAIGIFFGISKYKRQIIKKKRAEIIKIAEDTLSVANQELSQPIKENPLTSTLISAFAGFIAGDKIL